MVFEDISSQRIGLCAGLVLEYEGGDGMFAGRAPAEREMAACTSCAAASTLRLRSNCSVMLVSPTELDEVMFWMPGIVENWLSSGVGTVEAIVSGFAPGSAA